jgi:transcriptional regulator with XRE-family HTH domain
MAETLHHIGRKISRIRELKSMKQETLAAELGISQQAVSRIEQSESVDEEALNKIAKALGVNAATIKSFDEEKAINIFSNTYNDNSSILGTYNFNPLDKLMVALDDNKKLYEDKVLLLERLLQSEREKIEMLKQNKK